MRPYNKHTTHTNPTHGGCCIQWRCATRKTHTKQHKKLNRKMISRPLYSSHTTPPHHQQQALPADKGLKFHTFIMWDTQQPHQAPHPHCGYTPHILPRKEVIQPHLPVRLPCYDFVPIANPTFDHSPHHTWWLGHGLRVLPTFMT